MEQSAWTASATGHHLRTIQTIAGNVYVWLVSWATAPCVWTLKALTRNLFTYLLTYLLTYLHCSVQLRCHPHVTYMIMHKEPSLWRVHPPKHHLATLSAVATVWSRVLLSGSMGCSVSMWLWDQLPSNAVQHAGLTAVLARCENHRFCENLI